MPLFKEHRCTLEITKIWRRNNLPEAYKDAEISPTSKTRGGAVGFRMVPVRGKDLEAIPMVIWENGLHLRSSFPQRESFTKENSSF